MRKWASVGVAAALLLAACGSGGKPLRFSTTDEPIGDGDIATRTPHLLILGEGELDTNAVQLSLAIDAGHCIEEEATMLRDVDVVETPDAVTVTPHIATPDRSTANCSRGSALYVPVPVTLKAPLGNRRLLDGTCSPPALVIHQFERREPCTKTAQEKAQEGAVGSWSQFDAGPLSPRGEPKGAWTGTEVIIVGGLALEQYRALVDGAAYNPATKQWRRIADLPVQGRVHAVAATAGGILALSHPGSDNSVFQGTNAHVYNSATDSWRAVPPPVAYTYPHVFWTGQENIVWGAEGGARFDPSTNAWRQIPPISVAGATGSGLANGGVSEWIAGVGELAVQGDYDPRDGSPVRSALFLYNPSTNRWRKAADPPRALGHGGSFVIGASEVFDAVDQPGQQPIAYDAKQNTWREVDALADERDGGSAYFIGVDLGDGRGVARIGIGAKPLLLLDVASGKWSHAAEPGRLPAPDAVIVWTGDSVLLWGRPTPIKPDDRNAAWTWTPPKQS